MVGASDTLDVRHYFIADLKKKYLEVNIYLYDFRNVILSNFHFIKRNLLIRNKMYILVKCIF